MIHDCTALTVDAVSVVADTGSVAEAELDINHILGRKVKNLSKNKYKFVSGSSRSHSKSSHRTPLPRKSQSVFFNFVSSIPADSCELYFIDCVA